MSPKSKSKSPKTVLDKIVAAIRALKSPNGSSRVAISKYLKSEFQYDNAKAIKTNLKTGVTKNVLEQVGQSFRVKGDERIVAPVDDGPKLEITDLKVPTDADAPTAKRGDVVRVKYVGKLEDGTQFDAASDFAFMLGEGEVIKGWDQGVEGMRVGGKRKLVVPSRLGYGKRGCSPDIPPNATLYFVITLKEIRSGED
mmetsp:Transcript_25879/g.40165  ORF Transcript_25879/g.40165 Transcript_25879/m.40165 type:complete len:197 (-) Transcript_25879:404-994(-)